MLESGCFELTKIALRQQRLEESGRKNSLMSWIGTGDEEICAAKELAALSYPGG
jgi:uncharacterized protein YidB (DUF937 family)